MSSLTTRRRSSAVAHSLFPFDARWPGQPIGTGLHPMMDSNGIGALGTAAWAPPLDYGAGVRPLHPNDLTPVDASGSFGSTA